MSRGILAHNHNTIKRRKSQSPRPLPDDPINSRNHWRFDPYDSERLFGQELERPTYVRIARKHIEQETLDLHEISWTEDSDNPDMIIVTQWVSQAEQDILFEHTRRLRRQWKQERQRQERERTRG